LGTDALEFKDAYFDGTLEADAITIGGTNIVTGSLITTLGTISAGVWNGTAIASAYLDSDTAHLSGTQTFTGAKTFADLIVGDGSGFLLGHTTQEAIEAVSGLEWQMHGTANADSRMAIGRWSADNNGPRIHLFKSGKSGAGGTIGTNAIVADGAHLGSIAWGADDGTDLVSSPARIDAYIDGTPSENVTPGRLVFRTAADDAQSTTERMRINSSGYVSIGAIDADQLLHLSAGNPYIFVESTEASNANGYRGSEISFIGTDGARAAMASIRVEHDGTATDHSGKFEFWTTDGNGSASLIGSNQGGSAALTIASDGDVAGTHGTYHESSDVRLKENITTIPDALNKVESLRGVNFTWKDTERKGSNLKMGFIAQEVEEVIPEVVHTQDDEMKTKAVEYQYLTGLLVEAVKELSNKVKELEAK